MSLPKDDLSPAWFLLSLCETMIFVQNLCLHEKIKCGIIDA